MLLLWKHFSISQEEISAELSLGAQPEAFDIVSWLGFVCFTETTLL